MKSRIQHDFGYYANDQNQQSLYQIVDHSERLECSQVSNPCVRLDVDGK